MFSVFGKAEMAEILLGSQWNFKAVGIRGQANRESLGDARSLKKTERDFSLKGHTQRRALPPIFLSMDKAREIGPLKRNTEVFFRVLLRSTK